MTMSVKTTFQLGWKIFRRFSLIEKALLFLLLALALFASLRLILPLFKNVSFDAGGVYGEGLVGRPRLLNPLFADFNDVDRDISTLIFSGLLRYDPSIKNFVPDLAVDIKRTNSDLTYVVTLREDALFHDGKPVTADDILYTFQEVVQDPGFKNRYLQEGWASITIAKVDRKTVTFTLPQVNSFFISYLTTGILPSHILRGTSILELEKHPFNTKPIGSGPFQFAKTQDPIDENSNSLTLVRFEKYYGTKPKVKNIRFSFYDSWENLMKEREAFNGIPKIGSQEIRRALNDPRFTFLNYQLPQYVAIFFQLERPLVGNKRFRQILMKSIDKERLNTALGGHVSIIDSPYLNRFPEEWIHQYDPKMAASILRELGYQKGEDGFLRNSKGEIPTLTLLYRETADRIHSQEITRVAEFIRDQWHAMGIRITLRKESGVNFSNLVRAREYDLLLAGQSLGYNNDAFSFWHSSQRGEDGLNLSQIRSFRIDALLEDLRRIFDGKRKTAKLKELEKLLSQETPALFLYTPLYSFALDKKVTGIDAVGYAFPADRFSNLSSLTVKK